MICEQIESVRDDLIHLHVVEEHHHPPPPTPPPPRNKSINTGEDVLMLSEQTLGLDVVEKF